MNLFSDLNTEAVKTKGERMEDWLNEDAELQKVFKTFKEIHPWTNKILCFYSSVGSLERFMKDSGIEPKLKNVDQKLCTSWIEFLLYDGRNPTTIKKMITALSSIFSVIEKLGVIDTNPFPPIHTRNKYTDYKRQTLTFQEMFQLYKALRKDGQSRNLDIQILTAFFNEMRPVDVDQLSIDSFSRGLKRGYITIPHRHYKRIMGYIDEKC